MLPEPRPYIPGIMAYPPGKPIEEVQREYGLESVVKLASNENPVGPSPKAVKAMQQAAGEMHLYPDGNGYYLKQAISEKFGVAPESIILANGSDEISDMLFIAYLAPDQNVVMSEFDFISYRLGVMAVGANYREVPLKDWRPDLDAMAEAIDGNTKVVCIANPSNPVGTMVEKAEFEAFLERVPEHVLILFDQAYFEYVSNRAYPNGFRYLKKHPNLITTRTFSKAYGLAGLRVGYGVAHPEIVRNFDRVRPPFNVNRMAHHAALAALDDEAHLRRSVEVNEKGRKVFEDMLPKLGLDYVPSVTNFILVDTKRSAARVTASLMEQGVIVRPMTGYGLPHHVRITIGRPGENRRLMSALRSTLEMVEVEQ